ncbi:MAG: DNA-processing protein DprA [Erysipelotrichaceae bacterium]|nr:DNA-processing protein DprA [Erysipelotrichaceae bacterium]
MEREQLLCYALRAQGDYRRIYQNIKEQKPYCAVDYHGAYLTIIDPEYPAAFLKLKYPPFVLFYHGNLCLLQRKAVAVIGSRNASDYGKDMTVKFVKELSRRYIIVSGMAKGIDRIAHETALENGSSIGVLGCGIDYIYPYENKMLYQAMKTDQLLISEYPANHKPFRHHFPFRNRLIAALGSSLIVTEAQMHSGTMLTVNEALELSHDVYAVPYPLSEQESGCNYLIRQGANMITNMDDLQNI